MGNKLCVDSKSYNIDDIISFPTENLKPPEKMEKTDYQNLKVWRFYEKEENDESEIKSEPVLLSNIKEEHFILSSSEAYIILLVYKGKDDPMEIPSFPNSLWGIVESSSN